MESQKRRRIPRFLTDAQVATIRNRAATGEKQITLAREFEVSIAAISLIVNGHRRTEPMGDPE